MGRKFLASSCLFFLGGGDYGTMHLPAEAAATRCYDLNTAAWRDDWLRGEAGVVEGVDVDVGVGWAGAALPHPRISRSTFKIQIFSRARNWSIPLIISPSLLPLISYATAPLSSHHCLLTSPVLPSTLAGGEKKSKGESNAKRETENIKGQRERRAKHSHPFLIKAVPQKHFFFLVVPHDNPAQATKSIQELRILVASHHTRHGCFHHHLIRQWAASLSSPLCCNGI